MKNNLIDSHKLLLNTIIFITGASSGIGAACAKLFASQGAKLLLCARRLEKLNALANQLQSEYGTETHCLELDVTQQHNVKKAVHDLPEAWQSIDVLINNAGVALGLERLQEGNVDDWEQMIDTNIKGLLYVTKEILPIMMEKNSGHIINIGSVAGHWVYPNGAIYCATKHAVNALTQGLRMDLLGKKIRVSTIDPGIVETNLSLVRFKGDEKRAAAVYEGFEPLTPEDIADAVVYCASRPLHVNVNEIIIMPTDQAAVGMVSKHLRK